jgi:hypothetical protein
MTDLREDAYLDTPQECPMSTVESCQGLLGLKTSCWRCTFRHKRPDLRPVSQHELDAKARLTRAGIKDDVASLLVTNLADRVGAKRFECI